MSIKKEVSASEVKPKPVKHENVMYLGPTIVGVVRHSTVFKDGALPEKAKECVEQYPMMAKLFVPISGISEAVKEINKGQSVLHTIYVQVKNKFI